MQTSNVSDTTAPEILTGFISEREFCRQLGITTRTARTWRQGGDGPPYLVVAREILHPVDGVRQWLARRVIDPARAAKDSNQDREHQT